MAKRTPGSLQEFKIPAIDYIEQRSSREFWTSQME